METQRFFQNRRSWIIVCVFAVVSHLAALQALASTAADPIPASSLGGRALNASIPLTKPALETNSSSGLTPVFRPLRIPLDPVFSTNLAAPMISADDKIQELQVRLVTARQQIREHGYADAEKNLRFILEANAPDDLRRAAFLELAQVARDEGDLPRAQQIYSQFLHLYPQDPDVPEVYLRQGLIYRDMGATLLALTKFYSVMSSSLNLKLDRLEYYKRVVLQAQTEIADTYYLQGKYSDAIDFFERLLKESPSQLNQKVIVYKVIRCLSMLDRYSETVTRGEEFLTTPRYVDAPEVPEVRFLVADALKKLGRSHEALEQVFLLLQAQQKNAAADEQTWHYWQQRAGNEIANQLYLEKDYVNALSVYSCLANLNTAPSWQLPVWYQLGLVYEKLHQPAKATEYYDKIINGQKGLSESDPSASLSAVISMAKWRKTHLSWQAKAEEIDHELQTAKGVSTQ